MSTWVDVAPAEEVPPGDRRVVNVDDTLIAVFNVDGEYFAIQDLCTHDGAPLAGG
ncbi:MAG: Rieske 2Fe-2S domain-containing protein, partial [Chromatiales bacterium]